MVPPLVERPVYYIFRNSSEMEVDDSDIKPDTTVESVNDKVYL